MSSQLRILNKNPLSCRWVPRRRVYRRIPKVPLVTVFYTVVALAALVVPTICWGGENGSKTANSPADQPAGEERFEVGSWRMRRSSPQSPHRQQTNGSTAKSSHGKKKKPFRHRAAAAPPVTCTHAVACTGDGGVCGVVTSDTAASDTPTSDTSTGTRRRRHHGVATATDYGTAESSHAETNAVPITQCPSVAVAGLYLPEGYQLYAWPEGDTPEIIDARHSKNPGHQVYATAAGHDAFAAPSVQQSAVALGADESSALLTVTPTNSSGEWHFQPAQQIPAQPDSTTQPSTTSLPVGAASAAPFHPQILAQEAYSNPAGYEHGYTAAAAPALSFPTAPQPEVGQYGMHAVENVAVQAAPVRPCPGHRIGCWPCIPELTSPPAAHGAHPCVAVALPPPHPHCPHLHGSTEGMASAHPHAAADITVVHIPCMTCRGYVEVKHCPPPAVMYCTAANPCGFVPAFHPPCPLPTQHTGMPPAAGNVNLHAAPSLSHQSATHPA